MQEVKNIIFDLGGVIINLDTGLTIREFNRISEIHFDSFYSPSEQSEIFNLFDKGQISDYDFFKSLKKLIRHKGPDEELLAAWNAMLLNVPENRLEVLVKAKQNYHTFLLSNTCEPHIKTFERDLYLHHGVKNFSDYFDDVYYSCRIGLRKPDKEIFEHVLEKSKLKRTETIFIDDSVQHVQAAGECGIRAYLLQKNMEVGDLLKELKLL